MFADEFEGGIRTDFRDRVNVITAQKNAEIDKL